MPATAWEMPENFSLLSISLLLFFGLALVICLVAYGNKKSVLGSRFDTHTDTLVVVVVVVDLLWLHLIKTVLQCQLDSERSLLAPWLRLEMV